MQQFIEKHQDDIAGVLAGFDRLVLRGTLVQVQIGRRLSMHWLTRSLIRRNTGAFWFLWAERSLRTAPPPAVQRLVRRSGFDYEASVRRHLEENPPPPIVALRPITP